MEFERGLETGVLLSAGAAIGIVLLLVAQSVSSGRVYVTRTQTTSTTTTITSFQSQIDSTSQTSEMVLGRSTALNGEILSVSLNSSQLTPGQTLQVNASIFNTLPTINNFTAISDAWPFQGIPLALWPTCFEGLPDYPTAAEAVVIKGDYTMANITSVADIYFEPSVCMEGMTVDYVTFFPSSAQANLTGGYSVCQGTPPCGGGPGTVVGPYEVANSFTTTGYWNLPSNSERQNPANVILDYDYAQNQAGLGPTATPFTPGIYTVGIEDMWGQAVILHFTVST